MNVKLAKNYSIFFMGTGLNAVAGFIASIIYNRQFAPDVYGQYSFANTTYTILYAFLCGWIASSFFRYYLEFKSAEKETRLFNTVFSALTVITGVMLLIMVLFYNTIMHNETGLMIMLFAFNFLPRCLVDLYVSKFKLDNTMGRFFAVTVGNTYGTLALSLVLIFVVRLGVVSLVVSPVIMSALLLAVLSFRNSGFIRFGIDSAILKEFWTYGSPLIITGLINMALALSDRYLIRLFFSDRELGIYGYTYDFTDRTLRVFVNVFILTIQTYLMQVWHQEKERYGQAVKVYTRYYYIAFIPLLFVMDLVMDFMFNNVFDPRYMEGRAITLAVLISIFFDGLLSLASRGFVVLKGTHHLRNASIVAIIVNVGLNVLLMGVFHVSYISAAYTTLAAYFAYIVSVYVLSVKKINWKWEFYDRVLLTSLPYWIVCYTLLRFIPYQLVRFALLVPVLIVYYFILPKDIKQMVRNYSGLVARKIRG